MRFSTWHEYPSPLHSTGSTDIDSSCVNIARFRELKSVPTECPISFFLFLDTRYSLNRSALHQILPSLEKPHKFLSFSSYETRYLVCSSSPSSVSPEVLLYFFSQNCWGLFAKYSRCVSIMFVVWESVLRHLLLFVGFFHLEESFIVSSFQNCWGLFAKYSRYVFIRVSHKFLSFSSYEMDTRYLVCFSSPSSVCPEVLLFSLSKIVGLICKIFLSIMFVVREINLSRKNRRGENRGGLYLLEKREGKKGG